MCFKLLDLFVSHVHYCSWYRLARDYMEEQDVNWWHTPPESPDCNPIENLWHEMKEYIRREVKPSTKQQLTDGIEEFWLSVNVLKCRKYIGHLKKVLPKVEQ